MIIPEFSFKRYRKWVIPLIILLLLIKGAAVSCEINADKLIDGLLKGFSFLGYMFPPDWSAFKEMAEPAFQSVVVAFLGTVFGTVLSIFFALFAAANLTNKWIRNVVRFLIGIERSIPELFIMLLLIAAFGLGVMPAVIALALGCVGMLGKLLADIIEELDATMLESMHSVGANKAQVIVFGVFPEILPNIISYSLFRFEINIRLSVLLGAIGAGGIGYELDYAFSMLQYHRAFTALIIILLLVFGIEQLSGLLRNKLKIQAVLK
jgi:phosphonate transport system permease protein